MVMEALKFAGIFYLFLIAITAILPDSSYFRKIISFPFQIVYLVVRLLLTTVTFGKVKLPRLQRKAARNLRRMVPEQKDNSYLESQEKVWSSSGSITSESGTAPEEAPFQKRHHSDPKPKLDVGPPPEKIDPNAPPQKPSIPWIEDPE